MLRSALDDDAVHPRYIGVVRSQGYRLIPAVECESVTPSAAAAEFLGSVGGRSSPRTARWLAVGVFGIAAGLAAFTWLSVRDRQRAAPPASRPSMEATVNSIAVLPFVDLSERHDQQYLSDGITEEILDRSRVNKAGFA